MKTNLTRILGLTAILTCTLLASCSSRPSYQNQSRVRSSVYPQATEDVQGYTHRGGHSPRAQYHEEGGVRKVDNGHQGGFLQRRHADGTPVGAPVWVPGAAPGKTLNGLSVNHKERVHLNEAKLAEFLKENGS